MAHCDQTLVVTAWVPLVDATIENGCMYVLPWSFDQGILPHKTGEDSCRRRPLPNCDYASGCPSG